MLLKLVRNPFRRRVRGQLAHFPLQAGQNGEVNSLNRKHGIAIIAVDVSRFYCQINTNEVFGTHTGIGSATPRLYDLGDSRPGTGPYGLRRGQQRDNCVGGSRPAEQRLLPRASRPHYPRGILL